MVDALVDPFLSYLERVDCLHCSNSRTRLQKLELDLLDSVVVADKDAGVEVVVVGKMHIDYIQTGVVEHDYNKEHNNSLVVAEVIVLLHALIAVAVAMVTVPKIAVGVVVAVVVVEVVVEVAFLQSTLVLVLVLVLVPFLLLANRNLEMSEFLFGACAGYNQE